jgi:BirA family biotin operon repressor/biotin-[acetyl-CoA-carboxylase] ligase
MFAVVGIGVNVNQESFPADLASRAASLRQSAGRPVDRPVFAAVLLAELASRLGEVESAFGRIVGEAARRSAVLGEWVRFHAADATFEGKAEALDADGNLLLRTADGTLRTMSSGEVSTHPTGGVPDRE